MALPPRIEYPYTVSHITSRGAALEELFKQTETKAQRNKNICDAHMSCGYSLKEIADHLQIHYTTVSKVLTQKAGMENDISRPDPSRSVS
jgi:DNA-binding NarL/FixJ family response regulator